MVGIPCCAAQLRKPKTRWDLQTLYIHLLLHLWPLLGFDRTSTADAVSSKHEGSQYVSFHGRRDAILESDMPRPVIGCGCLLVALPELTCRINRSHFDKDGFLGFSG